MLIEDLTQLVPELLTIARRAGRAILGIYEPFSAGLIDVKLGDKIDQSPLTLADVESHNAIVAGLNKLKPLLPVVSEEDASSWRHRTALGAFWLIDPLDGTKEFLAKSRDFTVNIALVENGEVLWGAVYAPALDLLYWGGKGLSSYCQVGADVVQLQCRYASSKYRVVSSKSHFNNETRDFLDSLGDIELLQAGSSLKFCRIAEGVADIYPRLGPTCEWDTAAAQAVLEGAGGYVVDLKMQRLSYGKTEVLNPYFVALSDLKLLFND